ncbi:hypothetical protein F0562_017838 [Nyssa sinensis]|uniref:Uncharacterized protein n=1 Tax=Nyssa sinensis TaxID=561372 RepID=A0A5J4ZJ52_9ASTE|nr:hypothetical protein F0562_017838 [Nyssa sinensis]
MEEATASGLGFRFSTEQRWVNLAVLLLDEVAGKLAENGGSGSSGAAGDRGSNMPRIGTCSVAGVCSGSNRSSVLVLWLCVDVAVLWRWRRDGSAVVIDPLNGLVATGLKHFDAI